MIEFKSFETRTDFGFEFINISFTIKDTIKDLSVYRFDLYRANAVTDDFKLAGITRIKKFVNSCYIECDKLCFPESSRMDKIIFTTTDCTFKSLMSEFLINDFYFQNDPKANFIWNMFVDKYLTSVKVDNNENIASVNFDKDEPYNLFKEVEELIKNDDDDIFFEKIKRIDKILELKN